MPRLKFSVLVLALLVVLAGPSMLSAGGFSLPGPSGPGLFDRLWLRGWSWLAERAGATADVSGGRDLAASKNDAGSQTDPNGRPYSASSENEAGAATDPNGGPR